ncbi:hypothetical protein [Micromonospora sp. I033]
MRRAVTSIAAAVFTVLALTVPGAAHAQPAGGSQASQAGEVWNGAWYTVPPGQMQTLYNLNGYPENFWVGTFDTYTNPGELWHRWQNPNGSWPTQQSLKGVIYDSWCGNRNKDGRLEIFVKAAGGDVNHNFQLKPAGDWSGWRTLGGRIAAGRGVWCATDGDGNLGIGVYGPDNMWHYKWQVTPGGSWTGWL